MKAYHFVRCVSIVGMVFSVLAPIGKWCKNYITDVPSSMTPLHYLSMFMFLFMPWALIFLLCSFRIYCQQRKETPKGDS